MRSHNTLLPLSFVFLLALLAGCSLPGSGGGADPVSTEPAAPGSGISPEVYAAHPCLNELLPVVPGASWDYLLSGSVSDTITRSILEEGGGAFTDQDLFASGVTRTSAWSCEAGNLTNLDPAGGTSGTVTATGLSASVTTTAQSGVTLPSNVSAGDTWDQSVSIAGTTEAGGMSGESASDTVITCTALGTESVSVPAGTFEAMKVECQVAIQTTITLSGITVPPMDLAFLNTAWFAPNVGMVQSSSVGADVNTTMVLTSYSIP